MKPTRPTTYLLLGALLLTACSSGAGQDDSADGATASDVDISGYADVKATFDEETMDIILPLDRYTKTISESALSTSSRSLQFAECAKKDLDIQMLNEGPMYFPPEFNYGIWGSGFVSQHGYDVMAPVLSIDTDSFLPAGKNTPEENLKILSCEDQVTTYGDFPYGFFENGTAAAEADFQSNSAWSTDPEVEAWRGEWAACLEDQGYHIDEDASPWQPEVVGDGQEAQIRTALADVQCKESTGAFQKIMDRRAQYQQAVIDQHQTELTEYRRNLDAEMQEAQDLLSEHGITIPPAQKVS